MQGSDDSHPGATAAREDFWWLTGICIEQQWLREDSAVDPSGFNAEQCKHFLEMVHKLLDLSDKRVLSELGKVLHVRRGVEQTDSQYHITIGRKWLELVRRLRRSGESHPAANSCQSRCWWLPAMFEAGQKVKALKAKHPQSLSAQEWTSLACRCEWSSLPSFDSVRSHKGSIEDCKEAMRSALRDEGLQAQNKLSKNASLRFGGEVEHFGISPSVTSLCYVLWEGHPPEERVYEHGETPSEKAINRIMSVQTLGMASPAMSPCLIL